MQLFSITTAEASQLSGEFCREYFPSRCERAQRFSREEDRLRCIGAGALLHSITGIKEQELSATKQGKPYVPGNGLFFNLSHSGEYIVLAVDDHPVGVDVEKLDSRHLSIAETVYTPEELQWMKEEPLPRFFVLWTMKESVLKCIGSGLFIHPKNLSVLPFLQEGSCVLQQKTLYCKSLQLPEHILSVCAEMPLKNATCVPCSAKGLVARAYSADK